MTMPELAEAEALREAIRREAKASPHVAQHLERVEHTASQLLGRTLAGPRPGWKTD